MNDCIDYIIRRERPEERHEVENLIREAFWNVYRPGCLEHYVMHCLRQDPAFVPELNLVMTLPGTPGADGRPLLVGQVACMRAVLQTDRQGPLPLLTVGPIGILPAWQRRGYGKALLDHTLAEAARMGFGAVCFEGDIAFYGQFGFRYASEFGLRYHGLPEGEDASFFLCKELRPGYLDGVTGEYATPQGYFVDEAACETFDRQFPPKEKRRLPGQLW